MNRGYSIVALDNIKSSVNAASASRAVGCYGANALVLSGPRIRHVSPDACTDPAKMHRHTPVFRVDDVFDALPYNCIPVAVELVEDARCIYNFVHPERAFYIFGAEDQTLGSRVLDRCKHIIYIPTHFCMNLAATVNVVLYDRVMKSASRSE